MSVHDYSVLLSCVGSGLAAEWSALQGVLTNVCNIVMYMSDYRWGLDW
jgi:hypothetical protein